MALVTPVHAVNKTERGRSIPAIARKCKANGFGLMAQEIHVRRRSCLVSTLIQVLNNLENLIRIWRGKAAKECHLVFESRLHQFN
jgi:hypothetical protein